MKSLILLSKLPFLKIARSKLFLLPYCRLFSLIYAHRIRWHDFLLISSRFFPTFTERPELWRRPWGRHSVHLLFSLLIFFSYTVKHVVSEENKTGIIFKCCIILKISDVLFLAFRQYVKHIIQFTWNISWICIPWNISFFIYAFIFLHIDW